MNEILNNEFASVIYDEPNKSIIVIWKKHSTNEAFKLVFTELLKYADNLTIDAIISDIFHQGIVNTENRLWLQNEIMPKAYKKGLRKVAAITPNDVFSRFYIESLKNGAIKRNLDIDFHCCHDLASAKEWLNSQMVPA